MRPPLNPQLRHKSTLNTGRPVRPDKDYIFQGGTLRAWGRWMWRRSLGPGLLVIAIFGPVIYFATPRE
jgi:hypothetical protein